MKPRHAAALALAGWYLMMPPMGNGKVYVTAPLSMWQIVVSVATLKDCKNVLLNYEKHPTQINDPKVPVDHWGHHLRGSGPELDEIIQEISQESRQEL